MPGSATRFQMDSTHSTCRSYLPSALVLLVVALLWVPQPLFAHAIVKSSEPAAGTTLVVGTHRATLRFNNRIDRQRSKLVLAGPMGAPGSRVSELALTLEAVAEDDVLAATIVVPAPGQYRLRWQVLALDGHVTRGEVPFTVAP